MLGPQFVHDILALFTWQKRTETYTHTSIITAVVCLHHRSMWFYQCVKYQGLMRSYQSADVLQVIKT